MMTFTPTLKRENKLCLIWLKEQRGNQFLVALMTFKTNHPMSMKQKSMRYEYHKLTISAT